MRKIAGTIMMGACLLSPSFFAAQDHRYYDRQHHDYHVWNAREDRAYHMYWDQTHHPYREWGALNARDQAAYWRWRHSHNDALLNINIP